MPIVVRKLAVATLRHRIVEEIRQSILNGSLVPGERLVERDLAVRLGTSLTVAREAVIQLEAEGLITKLPNSSTHVTELSPSDIDQIYSVRCVLEEYAFVEAARHGTNQEIRQLDQLHEEAVRSAKAGNGRRYIQQDLAWHELVWQTSHNPYLYDSLRRVVLPLFGFSLIASAVEKSFDLLEDARSHEPLLEAISRHDSGATRKAYRVAAEMWMTKMPKAEVQAGASLPARSRSQAS
jgi:DNA-binding GntR family transcriptional regulator